jgi:hypothetical protein
MIKLTVIATVGSEPQSKLLDNGTKLTYFSVACRYRKKKEDLTQWINVSIFGDSFDSLYQFVTKGSQIYMFGAFECFPHRTEPGKTIWSLNPDVMKIIYHKKVEAAVIDQKANEFGFCDEEIPF